MDWLEELDLESDDLLEGIVLLFVLILILVILCVFCCLLKKRLEERRRKGEKVEEASSFVSFHQAFVPASSVSSFPQMASDTEDRPPHYGQTDVTRSGFTPSATAQAGGGKGGRGGPPPPPPAVSSSSHSAQQPPYPPPVSYFTFTTPTDRLPSLYAMPPPPPYSAK